jgi:hypothetical protein
MKRCAKSAQLDEAMRKHVRTGLYLFGFFFFLYSLTISGHFFSQDGEILYRAACSFYEGQGGAIDPLHGAEEVVGPDGRIYHIPISSWGTRTGANGREYPQYGVGQPLLATPLVALGRLGARILPPSLRSSFDHVYPRFQYHSGSWPEYYQRFTVSRLNQLVSAGTVGLLYLFLFRLWGRHFAALIAAVAYGACTAAWVQSRTFFTEPLAGFCILLAFFLAERSRAMMQAGEADSFTRGLRRCGWSGLAFGYAILTRPDSLLFAPGLILLLVSTGAKGTWRENLRRSFQSRATWLRLIWFGVPVALLAAVIGWMNFQRFGGPFATGYSDQAEGVRFRLPFDGIAGFLFSPGKSIFIYSPPVLLGLFGWRRLFRDHRRLATSIVVGALCFFLFEASWQNWEGGWCWGPRHIFQLTAFLMMGVTPFFLAPAPRKRLIRMLGIPVILALGFIVQLIGVSADFVKAIHLLSPTEIPLTIYNPAYSHLALHLRMLSRGDHDLFFLHFLFSNPPVYWIFPTLIIAGLVIFGVLLAKELRDARWDGLV